MVGITEIIGSVMGMGNTLVNRLVPDRNKKQDQDHETATKQADITAEGERARNYFTPRAMIMYVLGFGLCYQLVLQPFAVAFGLNAPVVNMGPTITILMGMLGLGG